MVEFYFQGAFDATKYPELIEHPYVAAAIEKKIASMIVFMDKMKGGVKQMRSSVTGSDGTVYWFLFVR
jgi:hypothetical protein